jgi:hypothetical protein
MEVPGESRALPEKRKALTVSHRSVQVDSPNERIECADASDGESDGQPERRGAEAPPTFRRESAAECADCTDRY